MGFVCVLSDPGLYVITPGRCFIFLWVDDLFFFSSSAGLQVVIDIILTKSKERYESDLACTLGTEITSDRKAKTITMTERNKIQMVLEKYSMFDCGKPPTLEDWRHGGSEGRHSVSGGALGGAPKIGWSRKSGTHVVIPRRHTYPCCSIFQRVCVTFCHNTPGPHPLVG